MKRGFPTVVLSLRAVASLGLVFSFAVGAAEPEKHDAAGTPPMPAAANPPPQSEAPATAAVVPAKSFATLMNGVGKDVIDRCIQGENVSQVINGSGSTRKVDTMSKRYLTTMILSYAVNQCRVKTQAQSNLARLLSAAPSAYSKKDSLSHYASELSMANGDPLTQNYALLIHLGMFESDGKAKTGVDTTTTNSGTTAEAGLFQISENTTDNSKLKPIYDEIVSRYTQGLEKDKCLASVVMTAKEQQKEVTCTGADVDACRFQKFMKACPAAAIDYAAAVLRVTHEHNGPINRKEVEPRPACMAMFKTVGMNTMGLVQASAGGSSGNPCEVIQNMVPADGDLSDINYAASGFDRNGRQYYGYNPASGQGFYNNGGFPFQYQVPEREREQYNQQPGAIQGNDPPPPPQGPDMSMPEPPQGRSPPPPTPPDTGGVSPTQVPRIEGPGILEDIIPGIGEWERNLEARREQARQEKEQKNAMKAALKEAEAEAEKIRAEQSARELEAPKGRGQ